MVAFGQHRMRVAVRGWPDVLEIAHSNGRWVTEEGQDWEIESLVTGGQVSGYFFDDCFVRVMSAC